MIDLPSSYRDPVVSLLIRARAFHRERIRNPKRHPHS